MLDRYKEHRKEMKKDYLSEWKDWLKSRFLYLVMEYLDDKTPDTLMRDDFNAQLEYIYQHDHVFYTVVWLKFEDLRDSREVQWILEAWNDLYLDTNEPDNDE